ncbi:uncharacterized protein DDB_G0283697-like [Aricia agestis]|uniref:uncharacterized protein DDB_G0283697-like n=1 Tax=Aricia agestis TaxID=91739 RepID=UPI001C206452|nr:uncharacterized protein DDB_G0283697-like [Aricia agestis]
MRFLTKLLLFGLCVALSTSRPSQTDDDDGKMDETEYEEDDERADENIREETKSLKSDNKRSFDDQAKEIDDDDDYTEPDSEDPAVKSNDKQLQGDQKISCKDVLKDYQNAETAKEESTAHKMKSNVYKRTSKEESEPTPDMTLKEKIYSYRDQNRNEFGVKEETIPKNRESHEYAGKVSDKKLENNRDTDLSSGPENVGKIHPKRDTIEPSDTSDSGDKKEHKEFSRKDLENLLSSLSKFSIEKLNILKTLINDENVAKRDIEKKSNAAKAKVSDDGIIDVRDHQEKCHSSLPNDSEMPHSIHSLNTGSTSGCEIKIPNDMCNLTKLQAELSDTDTNQDKTQSKEVKFMDDTLTDIMDMNNENNKEKGVSDLENIANLESFYDFSEHRNNYKDNENENINDYAESEKIDSKLLKRDTSMSDASMKQQQLEDSFPKANENSDLDLEPLVRVKRTEGQKYVEKDSKQTSPNNQNAEVENNISSDYDKILRDNDKLALIDKEISSQDAEVDSLENLTELKDVNRYKRIRQADE